MASQTPRFGFTTLDDGRDPVNLYGYKFTGADRILLDRILTLCETHRHNAVTISTATPPAPALTVQPTGGVVRPNSAVYYRYSLVDERGQEQVASSVGSVQISPQTQTPQAPTSITTTGGSLPGGTYSYALSAYTHTSRQETLLSNAVNATLSTIGGFTLVLPGLPSGADGFNIYRKGPNDNSFLWVASVTTEASFDDPGHLADQLHLSPRENATNTSSSVTVTISGVPTNWSVRVFRTYNAANWVDSLIGTVGTNPVATIVDTGHATRPGAPTATTVAIGGAPKIDLTTETVGVLPMARITSATAVTVGTPGTVVLGASANFVIVDFDQFKLFGVQAVLPLDSAPWETDLQLNLQFYNPADASWHDYYDGVDPQILTIPVGQAASAVATIDAGYSPLTPGFGLRYVVLQTGGGDTPTDRDLTVVFNGIVRHGSSTTSYVWKDT